MSSIEIRKYEYQETRAKNYFASPTFIDGISLDKIVVDGFPIFNEEFQNQFDSFEYLASDYDLVFSRLEDTLTTNGDTLEQFLSSDLDNHCLVCKVDINGKVFGGLIDVNSIKFIDNLDSEGYKIRLTVFGWAKEFSLYAQGKPTTANGGTINTYLGSNLFRAIDGTTIPNYFQTDTSALNWVDRVGYIPVIIRELWFSVINNDKAEDCSTWKLFEDLCTSFGIIYKFSIIGEVGSYWWVSLDVAFRDTGFSSDTVEANWRDRERGYISDINANVIQCFKFMKEAEIIGSGTVPIRINENHFYGTVFNKDAVTTPDGYVYTIAGGVGEEGLYSNGDGVTIVKLDNPFPFSVSDKVNFVDMNYYFDVSYFSSVGQWMHYILVDGDARSGWYDTRKPKYISFPRMFTKPGYVIGGESNITTHNPRAITHPDNIHILWSDLMENTCGACYPYLLSTFRKYVSGKISLLDSFDVNVFDKIVVNGQTYTIYKMSNLDLQNREVDIYAIQD